MRMSKDLHTPPFERPYVVRRSFYTVPDYGTPFLGETAKEAYQEVAKRMYRHKYGDPMNSSEEQWDREFLVIERLGRWLQRQDRGL